MNSFCHLDCHSVTSSSSMHYGSVVPNIYCDVSMGYCSNDVNAMSEVDLSLKKAWRLVQLINKQ